MLKVEISIMANKTLNTFIFRIIISLKEIAQLTKFEGLKSSEVNS